MLRKMVRLLPLVLILPLVACDSTSVGEPGTLSLLLTDDEGDFTQARVVIERIELAGGGDGEGDGEGGPRVLRDDPFSTDLLTLANDVASLAEEETVPAGSYGQLRFVISSACIGVEQADMSEMIYASDGFEECGPVDGDLQLPSYGTSGLKINMPGGALQVDGDAHILLLDFDVSQSFGKEAGMSDKWVMRPVIKAENISLTSNIIVELTAADGVDLAAFGASLADFEATLSTETEAVAFTDPEDDGVFSAEFFYLMPDQDYDVGVELSEGAPAFVFTLSPESPQTVSLGDADQAVVSFEVISADPPS